MKTLGRTRAKTQMLRNARRFVEDEFGTGTASSKVTYNLKSFRGPVKKAFVNAGEKVPILLGFVLRKCGGAHVSLDAKQRKHLIYLAKKDPISAVHELSHVAYQKIRALRGMKNWDLADETIASSLCFEWALKNNEERYEKAIKRTPSFFVRIIKRIFRSLVTNTIDGLALARRMQRELTEDERIAIRKELLTKEFDSNESAQRWILSKLAK
ncbi:MAG: hypothetical protein WCW13_05560 [archaeon]|jgi:hypothetical protein